MKQRDETEGMKMQRAWEAERSWNTKAMAPEGLALREAQRGQRQVPELTDSAARTLMNPSLSKTATTPGLPRRPTHSVRYFPGFHVVRLGNIGNALNSRPDRETPGQPIPLAEPEQPVRHSPTSPGGHPC